MCENSKQNYELTFILLLSSYDPETKNLLDIIKQKIAEKWCGEKVYGIVLDEVELYLTEDYFILVEKWSRESISIYIFYHSGEHKESYELSISEKTIIDKEIENLLREKYGIVNVNKATILDKLKWLTYISKSILVIRDKEETRGGEIAELIYCIMNRHSNKICLFKREGFELSSMLMEFLDMYKVNIRSYRDRNSLIEGILRYLSYRITEK